ncbi:glycosyltransferase family 87 protein [Microbacterium indicum]|uniref:glycosyltransferase family 87 protein n=1 Tax=Microbacterium indicum TaxID=358100 RepID=UPI0003F93A47|nr:glycosyltransferase family 87 protein [Microbacterium indicum]
MRLGRVERLSFVWGAFVVAHLVAITLGWLWPNQPMGDTYLVYEPWSDGAIDGQGVVGVDSPWVYPPLALAPMIAAQALVWFSSYALQWAVLVGVLDLVAFAFLVRRGRSKARLWAGLYWAAFVLLLGPIGIFRLDAVTVPLAVVGILFLRSRPRTAGVILALGTWMKIWPAAILLAGVAALRRRWRLVAGAAWASLAVAGGVILAGGWSNLFAFITTQTGRGLQIEAVAATPFMIGTALGTHQAYYDTDILTYQVTGPGVAATAAVLTPLMVVVVAGIAGLGFWRVRQGAEPWRILAPLAIALVVALIATNKVGSPQFSSWLIAPLVAWMVRDRRRAWPLAGLALVIAYLTQIIYPVTYDHVLAGDTLAIAVLVLRNVGLVVLGVWAVVRVCRVPLRKET